MLDLLAVPAEIHAIRETDQEKVRAMSDHAVAFRRQIVFGYPCSKLDPDLAGELPSGALATITIKTFDGISTGDSILETSFAYRDGKLVKLSERAVIYQ